MERCQAYPFIGLAEGNKCFCSFESPRDGNNSQFLEDHQCVEEGITCPGGETCGGYGYVAIWDHIKELKNIRESIAIRGYITKLPQSYNYHEFRAWKNRYVMCHILH